MTATELIELAFQRLEDRSGYTRRPDQQQLAMLLSDLIDQKSTGAFEAPTGLGKSLAALIPAIAHGIASGKRTVVATYTNILAEQYWRQDLPLAVSLFDDECDCRFLIGRKRYACKIALEEVTPNRYESIVAKLDLGTESEFRTRSGLAPREVYRLWPKVETPSVCPARLCPLYHECYYYTARREAERAKVVITNHSVVVIDAMFAVHADDDEGMLGSYDFLILDEAHDFPTAAANCLEFEFNPERIEAILGVAGRFEAHLRDVSQRLSGESSVTRRSQRLKEGLGSVQRRLVQFGSRLQGPEILAAAPSEVMAHPNVAALFVAEDTEEVKILAEQAGEALSEYLDGMGALLADWKEVDAEAARIPLELSRTYFMFLREFRAGCSNLVEPKGVSVSHATPRAETIHVRSDVVGLAGPLSELLWDRLPYAFLSATLAVDGDFSYFKEVTGAKPAFEEVLPSPFDFATQAALYVPPVGKIPDPTAARRDAAEGIYFEALARELEHIIILCEGRTLALFHSRKEMEAVYERMQVPPELPVYVQPRSAAGPVGEAFVKEERSSLFGLRSFWTGFDAPGETLSCVVLVRIPFEVPVEPTQIMRLAWLQAQGMDAFQHHTLPQSKMIMRQGAGRLIRRGTDRGVIALLDPRLRTKRYGEQFLANMPPGLTAFDDLANAVGHVGI